MLFRSWTRDLPFASPTSLAGSPRRRRAPIRPGVEALEDRALPATGLSASLIADIVPGNRSSEPRNLENVNGTLYFTAHDNAGNFGLYKSNGSAAGTVLVKGGDLVAGDFTPMNGSVYFFGSIAGEEGLWKTNGTPAGTTRISSTRFLGPLTTAGGKLYFSAWAGDSKGQELFVSDGTTGGTKLLSDIYTGWRQEYDYPTDSFIRVINSSSPEQLTDLNGTVLFTAVTELGRELWRTDGTAKGTYLVKDIVPGSVGSDPRSLTVLNGAVYFVAANALWKSDGTNAGTVRVKDFSPGTTNPFPCMINVKGTLFFYVDDGIHGRELWKSDGTAAGTALVADITPGAASTGFSSLPTNVNGTIFLAVDDGVHGVELWKSTGTAAGTTMVKDIAPGIDGASPGWLTNVNGLLYFRANDGASGWELWQSDGTAAGTVMVQDICPGLEGSYPESLTGMNNKLYFTAYDPVHGRELWDPPPVGTNILVNDPSADLTAHDTQSETTMVLGPDHRIIVAFTDTGSQVNGPHVTGYAVSDDGGLSFTDRGTLPAADGGDPTLARSTKTGTVFLSVFALDFQAIHQTERINIFRSIDDGMTFELPTNGAPGFVNGVDFQDKPWITVDNFPGPGQGNVYLTWRDVSSNPTTDGIMFTRSTDDGVTWGPNGGTLIKAHDNQEVHGPFVAVGPDHAVYVLWVDYESHGDIWLRKSTDQGLSFGAPIHVARLRSNNKFDLGLGGFEAAILPQIVANPVNGDLYVTYPDDGPGKDRGDILFTHSSDGGQTWSSPIRVNDDTTRGDQWQPALAVTPDGNRVGVFWYDRRLDLNNNLIDRFGAIGAVSGAGVSFGPNFRITDVSFPPVFGQDPPMPPPDYMGDYDVALADNDYFYTTWGDNRLSSPFHANQPDVRFARIPVSGPGNDLAGRASLSVAPGPESRKHVSFTPTSTTLKAGGTSGFTADQAHSILAEALHRWQSAGLGSSIWGHLDHLLSKALGQASTINLVSNDASRSRFVHTTPENDAEFRPPEKQTERRHRDLHSILTQEVGHLLGRGHSDQGVMAETLVATTRATSRVIADAAFLTRLLPSYSHR